MMDISVSCPFPLQAGQYLVCCDFFVVAIFAGLRAAMNLLSGIWTPINDVPKQPDGPPVESFSDAGRREQRALPCTHGGVNYRVDSGGERSESRSLSIASIPCCISDLVPQPGVPKKVPDPQERTGFCALHTQWYAPWASSPRARAIVAC